MKGLISICPQNDCNIYGTPFYVSDHQILLWLNFPHNQTNELVYVSYSQNKLTLTNKYSLPWNVGTITAYFKCNSFSYSISVFIIINMYN